MKANKLDFLRKQAKMEKTMKFLKYLLPCALAACGFAVSLQAENTSPEGYSTTQEEHESDIRALNDFVKTKGAVSIQEKGGNLMLSGDVRAEWDHLRATSNGVRQRGHGSEKVNPSEGPNSPFPTNEFNVEVNLMLDYRADRSWGKIRLQFDNSAGIAQRKNNQLTDSYVSHKNTMFGSGSVSNIVVRQAYLGYNVSEQGTSRFDVEAGRRRLYDTFDSRVQFHNFYDGLTLKYMNSYEGVMDLSVKLAGFVVDQTVNHFGYVGEVGLLNLADEGIDFKYSLTHWNKDGVNCYGHKNSLGQHFNVSQFTLAYNLSPDLLSHKSKVYGAFLLNHDGHRNSYFHHKKENKAFYVGASIGEIKRQHDWAVDVNYQWVQAQSIPESDVHGISRDNPANISIYKDISQGFTNYKGYQVTGLYALTDNLTLQGIFERVHECSRAIGGKHRSWAFEVAAIYAF
ncbi:MAG: hypothetical protein JWO53_1279 [Chlamydiia bacterium]|nr:hypothetical protein [Chlamydiia bacterium]